jgi:hypothetical protein
MVTINKAGEGFVRGKERKNRLKIEKVLNPGSLERGRARIRPAWVFEKTRWILSARREGRRVSSIFPELFGGLGAGRKSGRSAKTGKETLFKLR